MRFCRAVGKTPISIKDVPGFAVNRLLHVLMIEAVRLVEEEVANVQQSADRTYYKRGKDWIDSKVVSDPVLASAPVKDVAVGSAEFNTLVDKLVTRNRQSCLALGANVEVVVDGTRYRIR